MKNLIYKLLFLCISAFIISSCEEAAPVSGNNPASTDIIAPDHTISGVLKTLQNMPGKKEAIAWNNGVGKIQAILGSTIISEGSVDANGNFSIVLPGKMQQKYLTNYAASVPGVSASPDSLKITQVGPIFKFFAPNGIQIPLNFLLLSDDNLNELERYEYQYTDINATVSGTSTINGDKYNLDYTKGWNIKKIAYDNNMKLNYTIIQALPAKVLWYSN